MKSPLRAGFPTVLLFLYHLFYCMYLKLECALLLLFGPDYVCAMGRPCNKVSQRYLISYNSNPYIGDIET